MRVPVKTWPSALSEITLGLYGLHYHDKRLEHGQRSAIGGNSNEKRYSKYSMSVMNLGLLIEVYQVESLAQGCQFHWPCSCRGEPPNDAFLPSRDKIPQAASTSKDFWSPIPNLPSSVDRPSPYHHHQPVNRLACWIVAMASYAHHGCESHGNATNPGQSQVNVHRLWTASDRGPTSWTKWPVSTSRSSTTRRLLTRT